MSGNQQRPITGWKPRWLTKPISRKMAVDCLLFTAFIGGFIFRCKICGEELQPGQNIQFDHIHADVHGGPHEFENLRPVHYDPCHKKKTKADVQANAKVKRIQAGGRKRRGPGLKSPGFNKKLRRKFSGTVEKR